jgi:hypothetical protein
LHSASSHIQSKILSAAAAASQLPNTTPKFPPADVQKPELSTQKKSKPKKTTPSSSLRSVVPTQPPKFTHGSPSLLPKSRLPQTPTLLPWPKSELKNANQKINKKSFTVGNQILRKSFFLRQIKPTRKQRAM